MLIGSTVNPVHIKNYYNLVKDYFDEIIIVGPVAVEFCKSYSIDFRIKDPIKLYKSILQLRKLMQEFKPSIVHVHQANSFGFITSMANKRRFPQVLTTWGDDVLIFPQKNYVFKKLLLTSLKYSDAITADAEIMRTAIHQFYGKVKVEIANFGIEIQPLQILEKEKILYSNRLHDDLYNIDRVISGSEIFLKSHPDWKLIIAGTGSNTEKLKKLTQEYQLNNQIEFVGFLDTKENIKNYLRAKIYISIPDTDGTSISLLEAMAYGCLPILSNLPANKEWVVDGKNGIIIDKHDLAEGLEKVFKINEESAIKMNHQIIEARATKEANRTKFIAIYNNLLKIK